MTDERMPSNSEIILTRHVRQDHFEETIAPRTRTKCINRSCEVPEAGTRFGSKNSKKESGLEQRRKKMG